MSRKIASLLLPALLLSTPLLAQERWNGTIDLTSAGGSALEFSVVFAGTTDAPTARLTIAAQNAFDLPLSEVVYDQDRIEFTLVTGGRNGEFRAQREGNIARGTLRQGGEYPIEMKRVAGEVSAPRGRPQTPVPPFPYASIDVEYTNAVDGATLAGTLTVPEGEGPHPAAVLITGSGAQDRDETIFGHRPFAVLADALTRAGIAVLRVDDRGVGGSTAGSAPATSATFATDVAAGVAFLRARPEIDPAKVGVIGHSEGGLIGPMVAAADPRIAFVVMLAGPGQTGRELLPGQLAALQRAQGTSEEAIARQLEAEGRLLDLSIEGAEPERIAEAARELVSIQLEAAPEALRTPENRERAVQIAVAQMTSPWFRAFLTTDPGDALRRVHCPVLALNGTLDLQVIADDNLPGIEAALKEAGNPDVTVVRLEGLNHLFQHATTGSVAEYAQSTETMAPEVLERVAEWIRSRTGAE